MATIFLYTLFMNKKMKTKEFNNYKMNDEVYQLRRKVIELIYEAKKTIKDLPRVEVRIGESANCKHTLGIAQMKACKIWITEKAIGRGTDYLRHVVYHELAHAVYGAEHDTKCPLMAPTINKPSDYKTLINCLVSYR